MMLDLDWYELPLDTRAHKGGEEGINGGEYRGGEFMPYYVPRPVMPQVHRHDYPALREFAVERGCTVSEGIASPDVLKFRQRVEFAPGTVMSEKSFDKQILISSDLVILDGNHRAERHKQRGTPVSYIMLEKPFEEAIAILMAFPGTYTLEMEAAGG
jgi:hypothetical protein